MSSARYFARPIMRSFGFLLILIRVLSSQAAEYQPGDKVRFVALTRQGSQTLVAHYVALLGLKHGNTVIFSG